MSEQLDLFAWRPPEPKMAEPRAPTTAEMLAFPLAKRADLIRRNAERMAANMDFAGMHAHLKRLLDRQERVLRKKGIAEAVIVHELQSLRRTILAETDRLRFSPRRTAP